MLHLYELLSSHQRSTEKSAEECGQQENDSEEDDNEDEDDSMEEEVSHHWVDAQAEFNRRSSSSVAGQQASRAPTKHPIHVKQHIWDRPDLDLSALELGSYVQRPSVPSASWDAVIVQQDMTYIVQYSTRTGRGIKAGPIDELLKRLGNTRAVVLVHIIPQLSGYDKAARYQWQPYIDAQGAHVPWQLVPEAVRRVRQYAASVTP